MDEIQEISIPPECQIAIHDRHFDITITLTENDNSVYIILNALWDSYCMEGDELFAFKEGDYFQQTFIATSPQTGLGGKIHDFLIDFIGNKGKIKNIYSTNLAESLNGGFVITDGARRFWKKRITLGKAIFDNELNRYKIQY